MSSAAPMMDLAGVVRMVQAAYVEGYEDGYKDRGDDLTPEPEHGAASFRHRVRSEAYTAPDGSTHPAWPSTPETALQGPLVGEPRQAITEPRPWRALVVDWHASGGALYIIRNIERCKTPAIAGDDEHGRVLDLRDAAAAAVNAALDTCVFQPGERLVAVIGPFGWIELVP